MKRIKTIMVMAVVLTIGSAHAEFIIRFGSSFGIYNADGTGGCLPSIGDTATLQLIYAGANGVADTDGNNPLAITGDDELVGTSIFTNNGGLYEDYAVEYFYEAPYHPLYNTTAYVVPYRGNGLVYGRISTSATGLLCYYTGHIQQMHNLDPYSGIPFVPQEYDLGQGLDNQRVVCVPEPSTLGLLGVAAVGLYLARHKQRGIPMFGTVRNQAWRRP